MQTQTNPKNALIGIIVLLMVVFGIYACSMDTGPNRSAIEDAVKSSIKQGLYNPDGSSFSSDSDTKIVDNKDGTYEVDGYVDGTNGFGAKMRNKYTATVQKDGDNYKVTDYQLQNAVTGEWQ